MSKLKLAPWQLSLCAALYIVVANNSDLFASLFANLDLLSIEGVGFFLTIVLLMTFVLNTIFLVFGVGRLQKGIIALFIIAAAIFGYFSNEMGIIFDEAMVLNITETVRDQNSAEAFELLSMPMVTYVFVLGILPSLLLCRIEVTGRALLPEVGVRSVVIILGAVLIAGIALPNYKYVTYFAVEHRDLRFKITPIWAMRSIIRVARDRGSETPPFQVIDADAIQREPSSKRAIGIMVVGETARADHFSLNGYNRKTNPVLETVDGILMNHADSCGTSTLFSVPCMFSMRGRSNYAPSYATSESNVLDILSAAGIQTVWIDNNSSCKNVCDRIDNVNLRQDPDRSSPYYSEMGYYDEVLLQSIDGYLGSEGPDLLIVMHMLGSHGPAYSRRYPPDFGIFTPYCEKASPSECTDEEVANAYDNTIVYTDYVLKKLIEKLQAHTDEFDAFMFYASDHGESLGENGLYLHGLPYSIAPAAQTDIPIVVWFSAGFRHDHQLTSQTLERFRRSHLSHDNISHTLLGLFNVDAGSYRSKLDIFAHPRPVESLNST